MVASTVGLPDASMESERADTKHGGEREKGKCGGIDITRLRQEKGGNVDEVKQSELKRGRDGNTVDIVIETDSLWRKATYELQQYKKECNAISKQIGRLKKAGENCDDLIKESLMAKDRIPQLEREATHYAEKRDSALSRIGNILHPSVKVSNDEADNPVLRIWGTPRTFGEDKSGGCLHHHEVLERLGGFESQKAVEIAGHRAYYLTGPGVLLNMALIQYGLNFLVQRGYWPLQPPYFMRREVMSQTAELKDFEETLYRIPVDEGKDERDDLFLIATSEQPISAFHKSSHIDEKNLPLRYAGFSSCFRKEAGAHGKDTWGLFRIHQFEKIEQFCITTPEKSYEMQEEMIHIAQEFYESLELPYRVVSIVSGSLNDAAVRKYDLEAWFPGYDNYRELVSCSNCTDFQARGLDVRLGFKTEFDREKRYVHMLNGTLVATERCLCCILENYQTKEGVRVPRVLTPYMGGRDFLGFVDPKPIAVPPSANTK